MYRFPSSPNPHLYLLGIGGVGMVWLADYALAQGWKVSGVDTGGTTVTTKRLEDAGATIHYTCSPELIPADVTESVMSSAITPTSALYGEYQALVGRGIVPVKRAVATGALTRRYRTIAVAGTHGKTTTTAMIGWIFTVAGLDPTVFVGGSIKAWNGATKIGKSRLLILEADEFDRSFHQFRAEAAVLLNLEADHLECYPGGVPEIEHSFKRFLRNLPHRKGLVVAYGKSPSLRRVVKGFSYKLRWYSADTLWVGLPKNLAGNHVRLNATAAARVAHEYGISNAIIKKALATFPGVDRRMEEMGELGACRWIDDYAHHPTEVAATLQVLAERASGERKVVVFQPHQLTRTKLLLEQFSRCFDSNPPDELILAPIFTVPGREQGIEVSSGDIAAGIARKAPKGMRVSVAESDTQLLQMIEVATIQPGILLSMSAGDLRSKLQDYAGK